MIRTLADQYLAQNAGRRYPLADDAGYGDIPDDAAILDFRCTVRGVPAGAAARAWITGVEATAAGKEVTVTVDRPGANDVLVFELPSLLAAPYTAFARDESTGAEGTLVVAEAALSLPDGVKHAPLAWTTVVCDSLRVDSLRSCDENARDEDADPAGLDANAPLTGDIVLAEGRNAEPYLDGNRLRLDVFKGGGLGERCQTPAAGNQTCGTVLFTINGERPGSDGEIKIMGDNGVKVVPDPENHAVEIRMDDVATSRMAAGCAPACG